MRCSYPLAIDYARPIAQAIEAGAYDAVDHNITDANFPPLKTGQANIRLLLWQPKLPQMFTDEIIPAMADDGYRPATLRELLAFGARYPQIQTLFRIVALGSQWVDRHGSRWRFVPCIHYVDRKERLPQTLGRHLDLFPSGFSWERKYYRFAAVKM